MTELHEDLLGIAEELEKLATRGRSVQIQQSLNRILQAAVEVGKAWCGSWHGYHANVYYSNSYPFKPCRPPAGAQFQGRWGRGEDQRNWIEFDPEKVIEEIFNLAGNPNLESANYFNAEASNKFETSKFALLSLLELAIGSSGPSLLSEIRDKANTLALFGKEELVRRWMFDPSLSSRIVDSRNYNQNPQTPSHYLVLGEVQAIQYTLNMVQQLETLTRQTAVHIQRQTRQQQRTLTRQSQGTRIFIGHGRSHIWRALKDFLEDDLGLLVDEFNRVPTAGAPITGRLETMLNSAAIAFLVMNGEDEQPDGELRARENVVHEAGLFQGRLGFKRAIVLLEKGCKEFSNIQGLGHIPFPKDNIRAAFQDIRDVLEREGILNRGNVPQKP